MAQPNVPAPATPPAPGSSVDPKAAAAAASASSAPAPTAGGEGTQKPAEVDGKAGEAKKPANQLEAELAAQFGEDWEKLPIKARERMIASELKSREADKRMQLAAKLKKDLDMTTAQTGQLIEALKKDPWKVLSNPALGHDVRKLAEEYVWTMIQEQRMTPEQREALQTKAELASLKAEKERAETERKQQEMDTLISQRRAYWEKTIAEAIDLEKLPKTSYVVRRFADYVKAAAKARQPADMPAIAGQIRQELVDLQSKFLLPPKAANETDEQYEDRVLASAPNDYVKLLRKADLKRLRAKGLAPKPGPKPVGEPGKVSNGKMSMTDWLDKREQRLGRA